MRERILRPCNAIHLVPVIMLLLTAVSCRWRAEEQGNGTPNVAAPAAPARERTPLSSSPRAPEATAPLAAPQAYFDALGVTKRTGGPVFDTPKDRKSVILMVVDALNARHLGIYGNSRPASPHIDALARSGLLLSNHVSNSSWTRPSFATILTGLPKKEHGVEMKNANIAMGITTLAERFRLAGYRTAGFVGNPLVREVWGFGQGFQVYEDTASLKKMFPPDRRLADKALAWLDRYGDEPYFLMIFFTAPHAPYRSPRTRFLSTLPEGEVIRYPLREYRRPLDRDARERLVAAYDDEVLYMDEQVGRILSHVTSDAAKRKPAVVLTADHGEAFGEHNCYTHTYHMWDSVLRVPFILSSPTLLETGVYDDRPFTHLDIAPTLLDLAGVDYPEEKYEGVSMVRVMRDPARGRDRVLFSQYNAHGIQRQAVREGRWKLIHHHKVEARAAAHLNRLEPSIPHADPRNLPSLAWDKERYELYDIAADPGETIDLFPKKSGSGEARTLLRVVQTSLDASESPEELTEEMRKALENAGYLQRSPEQDDKDARGEVQ